MEDCCLQSLKLIQGMANLHLVIGVPPGCGLEVCLYVQEMRVLPSPRLSLWKSQFLALNKAFSCFLFKN